MSLITAILTSFVAVIAGFTSFFQPMENPAEPIELTSDERQELNLLREQLRDEQTEKQEATNTPHAAQNVAEAPLVLEVPFTPSPKAPKVSPPLVSVPVPTISPQQSDAKAAAGRQLDLIDKFAAVYEHDMPVYDASANIAFGSAMDGFESGSYLLAVEGFVRADQALEDMQSANQQNAIPTELGEDIRAEMAAVRDTFASAVGVRRQLMSQWKDLAAAAGSGYLDSDSLREKQNAMVRTEKKLDEALLTAQKAWTALQRSREIVEALAG